MKPGGFCEIKKIKDSKNPIKLFAEVFWKERFAEFKNKNNENLIIWKLFLFDHSGTVEFLSHESNNVYLGKKVEVNNLRKFFYRGKIRIFGNIKESNKLITKKPASAMETQKNYSKIIHNKY